MPVITASNRRDLEVHSYPLLVYGLTPLIALVLQAWLPRLAHGYVFFDLPLVVTIYFALGRRSPIQGMMLGAGLGIIEDAMTHHAIGLNGIAKTIAGFLAASMGVRIDVENHTIRVLMCFLLSLMCSGIYLFINRVLLGMGGDWSWIVELLKAVGNAIIGFLVFPLLDRQQIRD